MQQFSNNVENIVFFAVSIFFCWKETYATSMSVICAPTIDDSISISLKKKHA